MSRKRFLLAIAVFCITNNLGADEMGKEISYGFEYMGASSVAGIEVFFSPNSNWDLGLGTTTALVVLPINIFGYARYNVLDSAFSPFLQMSFLLMPPGTLNLVPDWLFCRIEAGIIQKSAPTETRPGGFFGVGICYQIIGDQNVLLPTEYLGFFPAVFAGLTFEIK